MILSFADREAEKIFRGQVSRKLPREIQDSAREKLMLLDAMVRIEDLWAFPSLRIEKLQGKRAGQWSIRINKQWRICFFWDGEKVTVTGVEITDYH
ncbi:MAG TPA: plasmid maintenance system killer [Verrucomicrobiales bacterium]|nr:plasmid maintenance system killer [Verrucomicrobiales bacterium]HRJ08484.1 type II toxin-antitoxin system RelE/ParE family toxin [Prosthecobacter sp.]HRK15822.1 type II toxin-antitoxin system RelE/ParE family toxin [Prosthecobacter sp.]